MVPEPSADQCQRAGRSREDVARHALAGCAKIGWWEGLIPFAGVLGTGRTPLADSVITVDQRTA